MRTILLCLALLCSLVARANGTDFQIGIGKTYSCALDTAGAVSCSGHMHYTDAKEMIPALKDVKALGVGENHACAIDDSGVKCWGDNIEGELNPPPLDHPFAIVAGGWSFSCALDQQGAKCWGRAHFKNVPKLVNPRAISAGTFEVCAIDDSGVKCWGSNGPVVWGVPKLANPRAISVGYTHACALDDSGVHCWGSAGQDEVWKVPLLKNPRSVVAGFYQSCAIDDTGVLCWGDHHINPGQPLMTNPTSISTGWYHTCAVDNGNSKCWGEPFFERVPRPTLKNPTVISVDPYDDEHACAIDDNKVLCWGYNDVGQLNVPAMTNPKTLSTSRFHTCAMADEGVRCWGQADLGLPPTPVMSNPKMVNARGLGPCAIDEKGARCWSGRYGDRPFRRSMSDNEVPSAISTSGKSTCTMYSDSVYCFISWLSGRYFEVKVNRPFAMANTYFDGGYYTSGYMTCTLGADGLQCWKYADDGKLSEWSAPDKPAVDQPMLFDVGYGYGCVYDKTGLHCWNGAWEVFKNLPKLKNPISLSVGVQSCAIDDTGLVCWKM